MGLSEETEKKLLRTHQEISKTLNFERSAANDAWKAFIRLYETYILEGEPVRWLACTLYVTSRMSYMVSNKQSSNVNLAKLLKIMNIGLVDFFANLRKYSKLMEFNQEVQDHLNTVESNFNVSMVLFKKFKPIFEDIFYTETGETTKVGKTKKTKPQPPSASRIFDFTWTFFIYLKSNFPNIMNDLVNSYHLLLACCDFVCANVYLSGRKDLLKDELVSTLPYKSKISSLSDIPCVIDYLCAKHDGIAVEAKSISEYCLRKHVKKLFDDKAFKGDDDLLSDVLDIGHFDHNYKTLMKNYENHISTIGCLDERVLLGYLGNETGEGTLINGHGEIKEQLEIKRKLNAQNTRVCAPLTPLTGKRYFKGKELADSDSISFIPAMSACKHSLFNVLSARDVGPSEYLKHLIQKCKNKPALEEYIQKYSTNFSRGLTGSPPEDTLSPQDVNSSVELAEKLVYKLLDSILPEEVRKPAFDPSVLFNQEVFVKALFACAAEVVLFITHSKKKFPWVLEFLEIPPYYFYKVIEVVVRNEDLLTRELVKHLKTIEESILESAAWSSSSPLWKGLIDSNLPVPVCEDVAAHPSSLDSENPSPEGKIDDLAALAGKESILIYSPGAPLADKFLSPGRKRASSDDMTGPSAKTLAVAKTDGSTKKLICVAVEKHPKENKKPKRTGSIPLFFRKFYYLASVRMLDMCDQLRLSDLALRRKIWTCFESTIVNNVGVMLNRHLDQILMCSIYVVLKIVDLEPSFMDMMKCYRNQPQAQSHVYRSVLISPDRSLEDIKEGKLKEVCREERGDIIKFYNNVYIHKVKEFTKKFRNVANGADEAERMVLSPIPVCKTSVNGPRRLSEKHPLFLRACETDKLPSMRSPRSSGQLNYHFSSSPAKDLQAINNMVSKSDLKKVGKQLLKDDKDERKESAFVSRKVKGLYADRMTAQSQDGDQ